MFLLSKKTGHKKLFFFVHKEKRECNSLFEDLESVEEWSSLFFVTLTGPT